MRTPLQNATGISLLVGTMATLATIALHPTGGSASHILKIQHVLITSHALAIFSLPFLLFGFFGLSLALSGPNKISFLGLAMMGFALIAALLAATLNGITLPLFISANYSQNMDFVNLIRSYGMAFSKPMACIFIAMSTMSIFTWSLLLMKKPGPNKALGYFGIFIFVSTFFAHLAGVNLIQLSYFSVFVSGIIAWDLSVGFLLVTGKINSKNHE